MPDYGDEVKLSFLRWLAEEDQARQDMYRTYREYYEGEHDTQLTERQRTYLQVGKDAEFNANFCPIVVDTLKEKLQVVGFSPNAQGSIFWEWWEANGMDGIQGQVHLSAIRDGDAYVMVEWDNEANRPIFTMEPGCCDGYGVKVHYSSERRGQVAFASKRWVERQGPDAGHVRRLNVYYPDQIEKYVSRQGAGDGEWRQHPTEGKPWPIPWVDGAGRPLGVPVVHFKNKDAGYDYGTSELNDVLPLQVALNKSIVDLLAAADTTSYRIYWMLGGNPTGIAISPGSWVYSERPPTGEDAAEIGYFPGEDLTPLIALKDSFAIDVARVSRTPLSAFQVTGHVASEGSQKQQESGLVSKADDRCVYFGNSWEQVMKIARRLANTFGQGYNLDEDEIISTLWAPTESRDETGELERGKLKMELGIPEETIWREIGYSENQVLEMQAIKQRNRDSVPDDQRAIIASAARIASRGA